MKVCLVNKSEFSKPFRLEVQAPDRWHPWASLALVTTPPTATDQLLLVGWATTLTSSLGTLTPGTLTPKLVLRSLAVVLSP